jgi:hypothetical protein
MVRLLKSCVVYHRFQDLLIVLKMDLFVDLSTREGRWKHFGSVDPIEGTKPTTKNEMTDLQSTHKPKCFQRPSRVDKSNSVIFFLR